MDNHLAAFIVRYDVFAIPAFAAVWLAHVGLTVMGDPLGAPFDMALWIVASILRLAAFISLLSLLTRAHIAIAESCRNALFVLAVWLAVATTLVLVMSATREWWAPHAATDSGAYYFLSGARHDFETARPHRIAWIKAWSGGLVTGAELSVAYVLCATQIAIGRWFGDRPRVSVPMGMAAAVALLIAYVAWCPWLSMDYDFFHGELFTGALVLDHVSPLANDPYTTFSVCCYLATWIAVFGAELVTTAREPEATTLRR